MSRTFAHDYKDRAGRYRYNPKKWEEYDGYWYGFRFIAPNAKKSPSIERFRHHGEYRVKRYTKKGKAWWLKPPSWCTLQNVTAPYRAISRDLLRNAVKATTFEQLEEIDIPKFPGRLKNADWEWV